MEIEKEAYHYTECGLDDVYIASGIDIDSEGNIMIKSIEALHRAIAERLVFSSRKLKGKEVRYCRHFLDWSQKGLATRIGVDHQTVGRWERGEIKISKHAEILLKGLVYEYLNDDVQMKDIIDNLSDIDNNRKSKPATFSYENDRWLRDAA